MTPAEFAEAHGLSLEEATYVLSRRAGSMVVVAHPGLTEPWPSRVDRARSILALAQKRVGVHPVAVDGEALAVTHDPDAERGLEGFYVGKSDLKKVGFGESRTWDEFDQSGEK